MCFGNGGIIGSAALSDRSARGSALSGRCRRGGDPITNGANVFWYFWIVVSVLYLLDRAVN